MPFSSIFNVKNKCSDGSCKINQKNIKKIFKPDDGFIEHSPLKPHKNPTIQPLTKKNI